MVSVLVEIIGGYLITRQLSKLSDQDIAAVGVPLVIGTAVLLMSRTPSFLEKVYRAVT